MDSGFAFREQGVHGSRFSSLFQPIFGSRFSTEAWLPDRVSSTPDAGNKQRGWVPHHPVFERGHFTSEGLLSSIINYSFISIL
jgi:hypothetical protein